MIIYSEGERKGPVEAPRETAKTGEEDIIAFARERLGFVADARQEEVLRSEAKRGILNCSRQWGKSTVMAVKAVHRAWTRPGSLVVVASPTGRQSGEWMKKAEGMAGALGERVKGDGTNEISLAFGNGSRIVGLPGMGTEGRLRGFSAVSMLLIDEAARVEDAVYGALRPMLAVGGGELWMMSTPNEKRGFFWETWAGAAEDWTRVTVMGEECGRIEAEFLAEERDRMTAAEYGREYGCEFMDNGSRTFPRELLEGAMDDGVEVFRF